MTIIKNRIGEVKMIKIGIIGHFGINYNFTDGQTIKTKEIYNYLNNKYKSIKIFDTHNIGKNIFKIYLKCVNMLKKNDVIVLIVSKRGYKILAPMIVLINFFSKKKIIDIVIGGTRYNIYSNKFLMFVANKFDAIFVETQKMVDEYVKRNITNAKVMYNFKNIRIVVKENKQSDIFKVCTFSRVCKEKGIGDAIDAVNMANKKIGKDVFYLDIYGPIDEKYQDEFMKKIKKNSKNIKYKGIVESSKSSETISSYDLMLFLTYWKGEGFPGTLIDAMFAGVPVIATDWNCNFEVLEDCVNAFKVQVNDSNKVSQILIDCFNDYQVIAKMKKKCTECAKNFEPEIAIAPLIKEIENVGVCKKENKKQRLID